MRIGETIHFGKDVGRVEGFESVLGGIVIHIFIPSVPEAEEVPLPLDPEPWVSFVGGTGYPTKRHAEKPDWVRIYSEFRPRDGYSKELGDYE